MNGWRHKLGRDVRGGDFGGATAAVASEGPGVLGEAASSEVATALAPPGACACATSKAASTDAGGASAAPGEGALSRAVSYVAGGASKGGRG